jgi:hypothetical protein
LNRFYSTIVPQTGLLQQGRKINLYGSSFMALFLTVSLSSHWVHILWHGVLPECRSHGRSKVFEGFVGIFLGIGASVASIVTEVIKVMPEPSVYSRKAQRLLQKGPAFTPERPN